MAYLSFIIFMSQGTENLFGGKIFWRSTQGGYATVLVLLTLEHVARVVICVGG